MTKLFLHILVVLLEILFLTMRDQILIEILISEIDHILIFLFIIIRS